MELNPNHPVTRAMSEVWYKIVAMIMHKYGVKELVLTQKDIEAFALSPDNALAIKELPDGIHLYLMSMAEGEALAKKEGGLPS